MEKLFFLVIDVAIAYAIGCMGRKRKIGFGLAFVFSFIFPLLGLIIVLCSKKKDVEFIDINKGGNLK